MSPGFCFRAAVETVCTRKTASEAFLTSLPSSTFVTLFLFVRRNPTRALSLF